jgi:ribose 5-phosphate isomerase B
MEKKKIIIGADSAGYALKEYIKNHLNENGYEVADMGTDSEASCHYPVFASKVCEEVLASNGAAYGILICGTGIGMSMCANKYNGIRAALCGDTFSAKMTRRHNDANVLCMGARVIGACLAEDIVDIFLENEFEGGRHKTRVDMMADIEAKQ